MNQIQSLIRSVSIAILSTLLVFSILPVFLLSANAATVGNGLSAGVSYTMGNPLKDAYLIGPGDVLSIEVYNQPDMTQKSILVRADGYASFNGIGEINVSGHSIENIRQELAVRLSELIIDPIVTVSIAKTKPGTVYLAGAFKRVGMYQISTGNQTGDTAMSNNPIQRTDLRLSNVIANSGGLAMNADLSQIKITSKTPYGDSVSVVNLWDMLKNGDASQDIMLQSGDSVYVPELATSTMSEKDYNLLLSSSVGPNAFPVRMIGEVEKPGVYEVNGQSPYLNSVIAMAGGFKNGAISKKVVIRRSTGGAYQDMVIDANDNDVMLRPNDIVLVPEKKLYKAGNFFEQINKILSPFTNAMFSAGMLAAP